MAWIFLSDSMLMPSLAPMDKANQELTLGRRTLQIRGRLRSHLENFIENYGEGLDFSDIEDNPYADYTCRFYATPEDFGTAMARAMVDIDYKKFKDTAKRPRKLTGKIPEKASEYAGVLLTIWSATQRVGRAGGYYSPKSAANPKGYDPNKRWKGWGTGQSSVGSSFGVRDDELDMTWWDDADADDMDYTPSREQRALDLLNEVHDIPTDQWAEELTSEEFELVERFIPEQRRHEKRIARELRRTRGKRRARLPF